MHTHMCAQAHTNICLGAQTHTQVPVCLVEKTSACVRWLACTRRRVALSKFNSHMQTGKTHTLRPKACHRARDGLTRWRGIAGCRQRRPGVKGGGQGSPTPRGDTGPRMGRVDGKEEGDGCFVRVYLFQNSSQACSRTYVYICIYIDI